MYELDTLSKEHLSIAKQDAHGRSAHLLVHDGPLRQTLIALITGECLGEHNAPPAASLYVLSGNVTVTAESGDLEMEAGSLLQLPQERHGLTANTDAVVLLTAATRMDEY